MNGKPQLEENAQFSTFFFAEQIVIFIHKVPRKAGFLRDDVSKSVPPAYLRKIPAALTSSGDKKYKIS